MKQPRGGAGADLLFFIFFLIVLGVIWALTGGPGRDISHAGPFLNLPFPLGNGTAYSIPLVPIPSAQQIQQQQNQGGATTNETWSDIIARLRGSVTGGSKGSSPYAANVTLSVSNAQSTSPDAEYVTIRIAQGLKGQVPISNWRIESAVSLTGATLGPASYLPYSGATGDEVPVSVGAGATVYVITGHSPEGESFRTNICSGYFGNNQNFIPGLAYQCPNPNDELKRAALAGFIPPDSCVNFVNTIPSCKLVNTGTIPGATGDACANFIATVLTYNGCVNAHKNDANFYRNEWYIYLDRNQELWKSQNEQIRLLDENGKVIATASYQ